MKLICILLVLLCGNAFFANAYLDMVVPDHQYALDLNLFEDVLDPELCDEQMSYILQNDTSLLLTFLDSGIRTPRGILTGNFLDLGNYYQCLGINEQIPNSVVEGKYCMIELPLDQDITLPELPTLPDIPQWPDIPWPELNPRTSRVNAKVLNRLKEYKLRKRGIDATFGGKADTRMSRISEDRQLRDISFNLAVCIPKVCTTQNALQHFVDTNQIGLTYQDSFCRLPNDKPWVAGDIVAVVVFSVILLLAVISTAYDLRHTVFLGTDPKKLNKLCLSFSVYTNTRRLVTYTPVPGALECLDGLRSFAMMWVILGHTFVNQVSSGIMANPLDSLDWMMSLRSVWITAGPITVDTFFMLSGLLLVYTTNGKLTPMRLLKNLHLFYLNRILRILPVLCAMILIQISFLNWMLDGPYWEVAMEHIHRCRVYWWSTILHVQNFVNPSAMCLSHSWYLAIDLQLHILSPILLVWILSGRKRFAWTALVGGLIAILTASSIYNFLNNFPSGPIVPARLEEQGDYLSRYYVNTLTRASPFFVGLIYGYLLSLYRGEKVKISWISAAILWICAITIAGLTIYSSYPIMQVDWDNQLADNIINSFMRPGWAMAIGWLVFACVHGYGGPVNWILSLRMWKVLGRLSYAMYITHYPLIFAINAMPVAPVFFSTPFSLLKFLIDFSLAVLISFIVTILVDSPCSVLIKHFMGGGIKKTPIKVAEDAHNGNANGIEDKKTQL